MTGDRVPGECPHEGAVADVGAGKSLCGIWGRWTNCREAGRCTFGELGEQMTMFDFIEEDDET